ncbi:piggyBac transposable element-derived protein 4-like [Rana temporaria]|uniref:piggyBac transposable element-derived protein 4-like n=1 Tax=Rana temporaria TaxID=8407 RepID=UPI001AAD14E3|nr:piggyBac transposable element-derived protein 4-like [Rana temporaria]
MNTKVEGEEKETYVRDDQQYTEEAGMTRTFIEEDTPTEISTAEETYNILCPANENNGELSASYSSSDLDSDSDATYDPDLSSGTLTDSGEEDGLPAKRRRSGEEMTTGTAVPRPRRVRTNASLPYTLENPVWLPPDSGEANIPPFTAQPGVQVNTQNFAPIDFFNLVFTEDLLSSIVFQCNLYAQQFIATNPTSSYSRPYEWKYLTVEDFRIFLGLTFNMGLTKKNDLRSYWSTNPIHHMPIYSAVMSRTRYWMIMRFLHYNDNTECPPRNDPTYDKFYKIRPLLNYFSEKFPQLFTPDQNISVAESLVHFNDKLGFKQFTPNRRSRYGVKLYKLCDRATGYTYAFMVYKGKDTQLRPPECPEYIGSSGKVVWDLIHPLLEKGYHLYVDNFYTSLPLFHNLHRRKTPACGTVRKNRKGFPQKLLNVKLRKGDAASLRNEETLAVKWRGSREVYMLSTIHNDTCVEISRRNGPIQKPTCVHEYNLFMGGVDFNDQMLQPFLATRRSRHWYKKVSIYLFNLAIYNTFVIYRASTVRPLSFLGYQEEIITALIYPNGPQENLRSDVISRLHERHFPEKLPPRQSGKRCQKKCRMCTRGGVRRDSSYYCPQCPSQPGLCIGECFRRYHTSVHF